MSRSILSFSDICFNYEKNDALLHNISFDIQPGEKVGLIGQSGSGKTTILKLAIHQEHYSSGEIFIVGRQAKTMTPKSLRKVTGLMSQNPETLLQNKKVLDEVSEISKQIKRPKAEIHDKAIKALEQVGLVDRINQHSQTLSLGEKRRLSLGVILTYNPELLLLDEPAAGLDPHSKRDLVSILRELPQAMLIASNDTSVIQSLCSRVLILESGTITYDGDISILQTLTH